MNSKSITREDVIDAENQLFAAQLISNVDVLNQLLHDELLAMAPSGQIMTKEMDLQAHQAKTMIIEEASTQIEAVTLLGDTAVTVVSMQAKGSLMGTPVEGLFRYLRVWKQFDQGLKIIGASFMQLS